MSKNLTLALPEDLLRKARVQAAEEGITLSEMVRRLLQDHVGRDDRVAEAVEDLIRIAERSKASLGGWKFNREEIHERKPPRGR